MKIYAFAEIFISLQRFFIIKLYDMNPKQLALMLVAMAGLAGPALAQTEYQKCYNVQRALEVLNEDFREAFKYVDKETDDNPDNPYAWVLMANCHERVGNVGVVIDFTSRAIKLMGDGKKARPDDVEWLTAAYLMRNRAYEVLDHDDLQLSDLNSAVRLGKFDVKSPALGVEPIDALLTRAHYYFTKENYALSDADYNTAAKMDPHHAVPMIGLGRNAEKRGAYSEAVALYRRAYEVDPDYDYYHCYMVEPLIKLGDLTAAADEMWSALSNEQTEDMASDILMSDSVMAKLVVPMDSLMAAHEPLEPNFLNYKMYFNYKYNRYEEAAALALEMLEQTDIKAMTYIVSRCCSEMGDYDKALDYARQYYESDSTDVDALNSIALCLCDLERFDEAHLWIERALDMAPDNVFTYIYQGRVLFRSGEREKAIEPLRTALLLEPESNTVQSELIEVLQSLGKTVEMQREAELLLSRDTMLVADSEREYGLMAMGRYDEAMEWLDQKAAKYPWEHTFVLVTRAQMMLAKGDIAEAKRLIREAKDNGYKRISVLRQSPMFCNHPEIFEDL